MRKYTFPYFDTFYKWFSNFFQNSIFDKNASIRNKCVHSAHKLNVVVQGLGVYLPAAWLKTHPGNHTNRLHKSFLLMQQQQQQYNGPIYSTPSSCCLAAANATHHNIRQICMTCLVVSHLGETMICLLKTQLWLSQWAKMEKSILSLGNVSRGNDLTLY